MHADLRLAMRQPAQSARIRPNRRCSPSPWPLAANAVVFSVLNALVLRPLNVPHSGKNLFMLQARLSAKGTIRRSPIRITATLARPQPQLRIPDVV